MVDFDRDAAMLDQAASDPNFAIRNLAGHFTNCNYGDWADFSKCECANDLIGMPTLSEAFQIVPLPLRDTFAMSANVSLEQAIELALVLKNPGMDTTNLAPGYPHELTMIEVAEAKARLRYLEADAMIKRRVIPRGQDEASNA